MDGLSQEKDFQDRVYKNYPDLDEQFNHYFIHIFD